MKKRTIIPILSMLFLANSLIAQVQMSKKTLLGKWEYSKKNNKDGFVECPDVIIFKDNHKYSVLNECYGVDGDNPVIETGDWNLNAEQNQISLKRKLLINYFFLGSKKKKVSLKILKVLKKELIVQFGTHKEIYQKL